LLTTYTYEDAAFYFSGIDNYIAYLINEANMVLTRSQTHTTLTLVHSAMVDYVENKSICLPPPYITCIMNSMDMALGDIMSLGDGSMDEVHDWRDQYGADLIALLVSRDLLLYSANVAGIAIQLL